MRSKILHERGVAIGEGVLLDDEAVTLKILVHFVAGQPKAE
jgi:hypothetical protein